MGQQEGAVKELDEERCVYCGAGGKLTRDHVPPKAIFPKPRPPSLKLAVVPACEKCNQEYSKDDEYFRLAFNIRQDLSGHAEVIKGQPAVLRSLSNPNKFGMLRALLKKVRTVESFTPSGIYLGNQLGIEIDMDRVRRVVRRTMRGLFFYHMRRRLPEEYDALVCNEESFQQWPSEYRKNLQTNLIAPVLAQSPASVGNGVFLYRFGYDSQNPNNTCWIFTFYGRASFLGLTLPPLPNE